MHRSYRPPQPTHNKYLQKRWDSADYEEHRRRVNTARSSLDTNPPKTYSHLQSKLKKHQIDDDRRALRERDDRILRERITDYQQNGKTNPSYKYSSKSLNEGRRTRESKRMTQENEEILSRIMTARSSYEQKDLHRDWQTNKHYMNQISVYSNTWWMDQPASAPSTSRQSKKTAEEPIGTRNGQQTKNRGSASPSNSKSAREIK